MQSANLLIIMTDEPSDLFNKVLPTDVLAYNWSKMFQEIEIQYDGNKVTIKK